MTILRGTDASGAFKAPGNEPEQPEVTLVSSPLHVVRAGSDARGPGAADAEADGAGVADAAGSPGQEPPVAFSAGEVCWDPGSTQPAECQPHWI